MGLFHIGPMKEWDLLLSSGDNLTALRKASDATNGGHVPLTEHNTLGLILAGGQARRLGGQAKGLIRFSGMTLLEHVHRALCAACKTMAISVPHQGASWLKDLPFPTILTLSDEEADQGPLSALHAATRVIGQTGHHAVLTAPWDCPFLPATFGETLCHMANETGRSIIAADQDRTHPSIALWQRDDLLRIATAFEKGERRLHNSALLVDALPCIFPMSHPPSFFNVNTEEDVHRLLQWEATYAGA
jgi:molybdenum cofactor guanylyltransferase